MKYIKKFENHTQYETYMEGESVVLPNVSLCVSENELHYNPIPDPYNGHAYVDLGLPSGTLWATMNVGASDVTGYGNYYMYGNGSTTCEYGTWYYGSEDPLALSADTAAQVWGGDWHMPTQAQMQELTANTTYAWVTDYNGSGINGGLFTAQNGNSVFFPAAGSWFGGNYSNLGAEGYYWSSSPRMNGNDVVFLGFSSYDGYTSDNIREVGYSVRPVVA